MKSLTQLIARNALLAGLLLAAGAASAQANLVANGGFETGVGNLTLSPTYGPMNTWNNFSPTGWNQSTAAYGNLVIGPGSNPYTNDWGGVGVAGDFQMTTPDGGNFVIADTDASVGNDYYGAISQQIGGLTVGQNYTLSFYQASSGKYQPNGADVQTTLWNVTFGGSTQSSPLMTTTYGKSTPWEKVTMNFTATDTSQLLTFLGNGTPQGTPVIMAALDGVSLTVAAVPEPATGAMMLMGFGGLIGFVASRRRRS